MAVLSVLRRTARALQRNPVLFVPVLAVMLFQVPQFVLRAVSPLVAAVVSALLSLAFVFVLPFLQGGIIGMAAEALEGTTSLDRFLEDGKSHYVSLLAAYLVLLAVNFAVGVVVFFTAFVGGFALFSDVRGGAGLVVLAVVGAVAALVVLVYLLFVFFVQFYGHAVVLDDLGAVDGLKHSVSVVRHHLASVFGYSILVGIVGGVAGGVFALTSLLATPRSPAPVPVPEVSVMGVVAASLVVVALGSLLGGFFAVYSVAFYLAIDPQTGG